MSGCLKGTRKKYDRQIGFDMRGFILSLFMLNGKEKLINWSLLKIDRMSQAFICKFFWLWKCQLSIFMPTLSIAWLIILATNRRKSNKRPSFKRTLQVVWSLKAKFMKIIHFLLHCIDIIWKTSFLQSQWIKKNCNLWQMNMNDKWNKKVLFFYHN